MSDDEKYVTERWKNARFVSCFEESQKWPNSPFNALPKTHGRVLADRPNGGQWILSGNSNTVFELSHVLSEADAWSGARKFTEAQEEKEICKECGIETGTWFTDSDIWNFLDTPGILCPNCFIHLIEARGFATTGWKLIPEERTMSQGIKTADCECGLKIWLADDGKWRDSEDYSRDGQHVHQPISESAMTEIPPIPDDLKTLHKNMYEWSSSDHPLVDIQPEKVMALIERIAKLTALNEKKMDHICEIGVNLNTPVGMNSAQYVKEIKAEIERLNKELTFRDFSQARASDIALNYGPYVEIQKSLSSEIALHRAWTKRAYEAEAENTRLKAEVSDEERKKIIYTAYTDDALIETVNEILAARASRAVIKEGQNASE